MENLNYLTKLAKNLEQEIKTSTKMLDEALAKLPEEKRAILGDFVARLKNTAASGNAEELLKRKEELKEIYKSFK